jgi:threonyl-tRNA synthetase
MQFTRRLLLQNHHHHHRRILIPHKRLLFTSRSYSSTVPQSIIQGRFQLWSEEVNRQRELKQQQQQQQQQFEIPQTTTFHIKCNTTSFDKEITAELTSDTTPFDLCSKYMSRNLVKELIVCRVNNDDKLHDLQQPLLQSYNTINNIQFYTFNEKEGIEVFWHSSAHLLGLALENQYEQNGVKLCDGPPIINKTHIDNINQLILSGGFFYESLMDDKHAITTQDLTTLEKFITHYIQNNKYPFERLQVSRQFASKMFEYNPFKLDIISHIPENDPITLYKCGDLIDLCRGPHIPNTGFIKAFKLLKTSGTYWKNNQDITLQRVYGIAFPNQTMLKDYEHTIEEALKRDHRLIGKQQDLFVFHEWSPGTPIFTPHGTRIFNTLVRFLREQYTQRGYNEVISPQVYNRELWQVSGHWEHYKDDMFVIDDCAHHAHHGNNQHHQHEQMGLKPMNCPGHCLLYGSRTRSYKDLPLRWADFSPLHRNEPRGSLSGLTRVRRFHQDDAHIFCTREQVTEEIFKCLDFVKYVYSQVFNMKVILKLSTRPEQYVGSLDLWNEAESALKSCLDQLGQEWYLNEGDGAFYGPKIDISVEDSLQRQFQCATIQLDFNLPQRFGLKYHSHDDQMHTPVMIHRAILGSLERFIALLTEHVNGKWPFWLSPRQCIVVPVSNQYVGYAQQVMKQLTDASSSLQEENHYYYYIDIDDSEKTLKKKIRDAQLSQYNYILVVGEQEQQNQQVNVRMRDGTLLGQVSIPDLLRRFKQHVQQYQ